MMVETRTVFACPTCGTWWQAVGEPAGCSDPEHDHNRFEMHRHLDLVALPGGATITAVSFDAGDPYGRRPTPDFGLYLDDRWRPPWPYRLVPWPDFGVPDDVDGLVAAVREVLDRAQRGERVEIGCLGGHGRTGTVLACLAAIDDGSQADPVAWVRAVYCDRAVETEAQEALVADVQASAR